jgi:serine/threonine protein kinase
MRTIAWNNQGSSMRPDDETTVDGRLFDGRYRMIRRIGIGRHGAGLPREDIDLHREVAIKVLHDRYNEDAQFVERFAREARAAAGLNHPNIVAIYDRGQATARTTSRWSTSTARR